MAESRDGGWTAARAAGERVDGADIPDAAGERLESELFDGRDEDEIAHCPLCDTKGVPERIFGLACPHDASGSDIDGLADDLEFAAEQIRLVGERLNESQAIGRGA